MFKRLLLISAIVAGYSAQTLACTYAINEAAATAELAAAVKIAIDRTERKYSVTAVSFSYHESISTPMCPKEITYVAEFNVRNIREPGAVGSPSSCGGRIKIVKREAFVTDEPSASDSYEITGRQSLVCAERVE